MGLVALLVVCALPAGFLIGAVAIGGVLLVPALITLAGLPIHDAVALSLAGFVVTGVAGVTRHFGANLRHGIWILVSAAPGAAIGATTLQVLSGPMVTMLVALFVAAAGIRTIGARAPEAAKRRPRTGGRAGDMAIGVATGVGSAMTGTGGPLILVPILLWRGSDVRAAITLGQAIQLPVSLAATITNAGFGRIDVLDAAVVGVALLAGMLIGQAVAERLDAIRLRLCLAVILIGTGAWLGFGVLRAL